MYVMGSCIVFIILLSIHGSYSSLIPEKFGNQDIGDYEIRYISNDGIDRTECLVNQSYPETISSNNTACASLGFALLGSNKPYGVQNVIVLAYPGHYDFGEAGIVLNNSRNIIVSKVPSENREVVCMCVSYNDQEFNNFFILRSANIAMVGITFEMCGPKSSPVTIRLAQMVLISNCTFRENLNSGLLLYQSEFWITNGTFHDNNATNLYNTTFVTDTGDLRHAGGLSILWKDNASLTGNVIDCRFYRNFASLNEMNSGDERPPLYLPQGSGGAIAVTFRGASASCLVIHNCEMSYNGARYYGGGVYLGLSKSKLNEVIISNSIFKCNSATDGTGGAISMNAFEESNDNTLSVFNSSFEENFAFVGGGACSIATQDNIISDDNLVLLKNVASFSGCNFTNNTAPRGGSAVRLISNARVDQFSATVNFTNCLFVGNSASSGGSLLSFRLPILLDGTNVFRQNSGGGITLFRSRVDAGGTAIFEANTAVQGAGISMQDLSLIQLMSGSNLTFIANSATTFGGAISIVGSVSKDVFMFFNTRCFIQYEVKPQLFAEFPENWQTSVTFINNTAGSDGAAIFASNIALCTYSNRTYSLLETDSDEFGSVYMNSIFQLSNIFKFSGNTILNSELNDAVYVEELATAPALLEVIISNDGAIQEIVAAPAEIVQLNVSAFDQANNSLPAVWSIDDSVGEDNTEIVKTKTFFVAPAGGVIHNYTVLGLSDEEYGSINCTEGLKRMLHFTLIDVNDGGVENETPVSLRVICCNPGYQFEYDNTTGLYTCEHDHVGGTVIRPDIRNKYTYVRPQIYVEVRNNKLVSAVMPPPFQNCTRERSQSGCLFKFDDPSDQCSDNRTGFMCGRCPDGTGVDLTLQKCRPCTDWAAVIVAVIVTVFVVVAVLVLLFNIGVPNDLKGCLFFVQVVGFVYTYSEGNTVTWDFHLSRTFGFNLYLPLCPSPGYDALSTALYGFILSFFAMATVIIYVVCARFIRPLSQRNSFDGIWLLSIITYKYTADTCFSILRCVKVSGGDVHGEFRYYYDGSITCFQSGKHLGIALFAIILVVLVVLLFPIAILVISYRRFNLTYAFTDVLTDGLKVSCRWWSGYDLYRRLLFITVVFFFSYVNPDYIQISLFFAGLLLFVIFARSKPYISTRTNIIEGFILLDLILITSLSLNPRENTQIGSQLRVAAVILLLLPFVFVFLYILCKVAILLWNKVLPASIKVLFMKQMKTKPKTSMFEERSAVTDLTDHSEDEDTQLQAEYSQLREELLDDEDHSLDIL